jgi:hypothetical protein
MCITEVQRVALLQGTVYKFVMHDEYSMKLTKRYHGSVLPAHYMKLARKYANSQRAVNLEGVSSIREALKLLEPPKEPKLLPTRVDIWNCHVATQIGS